jgi:two-component system sensor histidine kinase DegS
VENNIFTTLLARINKDYVEIDDVYSKTKSTYQSLEKDFRNLNNEAKVIIEKVKYLKEKVETENVSKSINSIFKANTEKTKKNLEIVELENDLNKAIMAENELIEQRRKIEKDLDEARVTTSKLSLVRNRIRQNIEVLKSYTGEITKTSSNGIYTLEILDIDRQRIAKEIHDRISQNILSIVHKSELCYKLLDSDLKRGKLEIQNIQNIAKDTIIETREIIYDLNPIALINVSINDLINNYVENKKDNWTFNVNINEYNLENKIDFKPIVNITLLRIIQETLNNISKHSKASFVDIKVLYDNDIFKINISDNGIGFNTDSIKENKDYLEGFGLSIMKERAILLGGKLDIFSECGVGTTIEITISVDLIREGE